jgi:hypothetical protein
MLMVLGAPEASAQPDVAGSVIIDEPDGFPGICNAPCYRVENQFEVFLDGNPTAPGVCPAGNNTYVYTHTHLGGSGPTVPGVTKFELEVANTALNVTSAGFIPGVLDPSVTFIDTVTDVVSWDFLAPPIANGQTSSQLFICSPLSPGGVNETPISFEGELSLAAPGTCVGPVALTSFDCSDAKLIDALTMTWNGSVDVQRIAQRCFLGDLRRDGGGEDRRVGVPRLVLGR